MSRGEMRPTGAEGGRRGSHAQASPSSTGAPSMTRTLKRGVALPPGEGDVFGGGASGGSRPPQRYGLSDDRASPDDAELLGDGQDVLAEANQLSEGGGFDVGDWGSSNLQMPSGVRRMRASNGGLPSQGRSGTSLAPMIEHQTHNFSAYSERGGGMGRTGRGSSSLVDRAAQIERQQEAQFAYRANKLLQHFDAQENKRMSMGLRAAQIREPSRGTRLPGLAPLMPGVSGRPEAPGETGRGRERKSRSSIPKSTLGDSTGWGWGAGAGGEEQPTRMPMDPGPRRDMSPDPMTSRSTRRRGNAMSMSVSSLPMMAMGSGGSGDGGRLNPLRASGGMMALPLGGGGENRGGLL